MLGLRIDIKETMQGLQTGLIEMLQRLWRNLLKLDLNRGQHEVIINLYVEVLEVTLRFGSGYALICQSWSAFILVGEHHRIVATHNHSVVLFNGNFYCSLCVLKQHVFTILCHSQFS